MVVEMEMMVERVEVLAGGGLTHEFKQVVLLLFGNIWALFMEFIPSPLLAR